MIRVSNVKGAFNTNYIEVRHYENSLVNIAKDKKPLKSDFTIGFWRVKKFEFINNKIRLIAENNAYLPIEVKTEDDFKLIGKVKGVVRWLN